MSSVLRKSVERTMSVTTDGHSYGAHMRREMAQQPEVIARLVNRSPMDRDRLRPLIPKDLAGVTLIARGSSDNAAILGRYLIERATRRPAGLAAPALHTLYGEEVDYHGYLAIALSQSGATPEIASVLAAMKRTGACALAITNDPDSKLAAVADVVYPLEAGVEVAVPATKTVTAQMVAMTVIASAFDPSYISDEQMMTLPLAVEEVLGSSSEAERLAAQWATCASRVVVVSRGFGYAAAVEAALKITETSDIHAQGYSSADLRHGPIASVNASTPVLIIEAGGPGAADLAGIAELARERGAPIAWCRPGPDAELRLPPCSAEPLAAILATVRCQQFALSLALARGQNPDAPLGLSKVTET